MRNPTDERLLHGGIQKVFRFENNYGASVVRHLGSYGADEGLWELAVLRFDGPNIWDFELTYTTPITDDVIGWLKENEVDDLLVAIETLDKEEVA